MLSTSFQEKDYFKFTVSPDNMPQLLKGYFSRGRHKEIYALRWIPFLKVL